jgi:hypothetical protein
MITISIVTPDAEDLPLQSSLQTTE